MYVGRHVGAAIAIAAIGLAVWTPYSKAAVDVSRGADGTVAVTGSDAAEQVTIDRPSAASIRITDATGPVTSNDASCTADVDMPTSMTCASPSSLHVMLGAGNDTLDALLAGMAVSVDPGAGADTLKLGSAGTSRVDNGDATDTLDLQDAFAGVRVRYETASARLVARCSKCSTPWAVIFPSLVGRAYLTGFDDDVDLTAWRTLGTTTWLLGEGRDKLIGAPSHVSLVNGEGGQDTLVSRTAVDRLHGGAGMDRLADIGGAGDLLDGGLDSDRLVSLDGRRDTLAGGGGRDMCLTSWHNVANCDTGKELSVETCQYLPAATSALALRALGITL